MYKNKTLAIVIPCYNEAHQLFKVISTLPDFVDKTYIIDDQSDDDTLNVASGLKIDFPTLNIEIIAHEKNQGVGGAIASGYKAALNDKIDISVVMAGDAQMDPHELPSIIDPVANDECDYSKGNRLFSGDAWEMIPKVRYIGNAMLSLLTKIASGYWHVADSQSGYTAINLKALQTINWDHMYKRYGQPNDLLVRLNIFNFRVRDIPIKPIYGVGEKSGIKPLRMIPKLAWLLFKLFFFRMLQKYVIRDFHPLLFFYFAAFLLLPIGLTFGAYLLYYRLFFGPIAETSALFAAFLSIMGFQFLFFGMWFDMENNKDLK
jgi:glycosyltransferase involved in cell wall biosynthesis